MGSFTDSIKRSTERVLKEIDAKCYAISYALFTSIVYNSPTKPTAVYAKGQFINNWFPAVSGYDTSTTSATSYDGMGSLQRIALLKAARAFYGRDNFVTLSNSLPYANQVEYLGWGKTDKYAPVRASVMAFAVKDVAYDNTK